MKTITILGQLELVMMDACGSEVPVVLNTWKNEDIITTGYIQNFTPSSSADWDNKSILISDLNLKSTKGFRLGLRVKNNSGNNLYLDKMH